MPRSWIYICLFQIFGFVSSKVYDKRDDIDLDILDFPFLDGDISRTTSYAVYISQLIRFARVSIRVADVNTKNTILTAKLLKQGYRYDKLRKAFFKILLTPLRPGIKSYYEISNRLSIKHVDEKATIRNRYNRTPLPSPGTIREMHTKIKTAQSKTEQAESQEVSSFPADGHQAILNKINKSSKTN